MGMDNTIDREMVAEERPTGRLTARQQFAGAGVNILLAILAGILAGLAFPPFEW